jgi:hypothetical protein
MFANSDRWPMGSTMLTGQPISDPLKDAVANANVFSTGGMVVGAIGAINSAIGSYFAAESQKNQLKMQAQNMRFASQMAAINARGAEFSAVQSMVGAERNIGRYTMAAGQAKASARTAMAGRGIQGGVGSARDVIASMDLIKEIDKLTMSAAAVREAEAYRTQGVNYSIQSQMQGISASNLMSSAGSISAPLATYGSLLGSASDIGMSWLRNQRFAELLEGVSTKRIG